MDAADDRLASGVVERLYGKVFMNVRLKPTDLRSTSAGPVIWRTVADLMAGILWQMAC